MNLPHITIQMPVYKESLEAVLAPSIRSLKKAMQTYARQGGTSNIFINDDGLRVSDFQRLYQPKMLIGMYCIQLLPPADRDARLAFYANHNIGWVARPKHDPEGTGFVRAGRFKKASNMNYGLALSLKLEKHLEELIAHSTSSNETSKRNSLNGAANGLKQGLGFSGVGGVGGSEATQYGIQYQNRDGCESVVWGAGGLRGNAPPLLPASSTSYSALGSGSGLGSPAQIQSQTLATWGDEDLEERALSMAIEETWEEGEKSVNSGGEGGQERKRYPRPWAANGKSCRIGEIVLIVDSDTVVPEDCLRDAAREMHECPEVGVVQHESDVLQVVGHYFENGIAYFTRRINRCISICELPLSSRFFGVV